MVEPVQLKDSAEQTKAAAQSTAQAAERTKDSADRRTELAADRTVFAAERTYAAWVRTRLVALASGIGARKLLEGLVPGWMITATGTALILFSAFCFVAGVWRQLFVGAAAESGRAAPAARDPSGCEPVSGACGDCRPDRHLVRKEG